MATGLPQCVMLAAWALGTGILGACASAPPVVVLEPPAVVEPTVPPPPPDTMVSYRVPELRALPLVDWGALPPGERRADRVRTYDLQHQIVRVRFDRERRSVVGSTTIRLAALPESAPLPTVVVDAVGMTIGRIATAGGAALRHDYDGRTLTIHLATSLRAGATTSVVIEYETVRPAAGAYFSSSRPIVWTHGEPEDTRHWVPTFDHPGDRTTWELIVRTPRDELALSNGRLVASRRVAGEMEWHWRLDTPAPTYLMSVVTGPYTVLQDRWRAVQLGYWTYADSIAAAWRGFATTPRMMELMLSYTGTSYPWSKYDQVVVPELAHAGVENVTATTMADDAILHPVWAEPHTHLPTEALVMHELAHHWFGNVLSIGDWSHVWLNEGFARMLESDWREAEHGRDEAEYGRLLVREAAVAADLRARRPLVYGRFEEDPLELFATGHVYARGAAVLEMLRAELGDSAFLAGVGRYVEGHRMDVVATPALREAMEQASGRPLGDFFDQWVNGAGYPAFRIEFAHDTVAGILSLSAAQVQPTDSLTGWFEAEVVVEVLTDSGTVMDTLVVRDSVASTRMTLRAAPRAIVWDRAARLLQVADFPRSTVMLAWQLEHADRVPARVEAVRVLGERTSEALATRALGRAARGDPFWAVRVRAATALGGMRAGLDSASAVLVSVTRDWDPRVREAGALALGALALEDSAAVRYEAELAVIATLPDSAMLARRAARDSMRAARVERLEELIDQDVSSFVRAAAVQGLAMLNAERGLLAASEMLSRDSWMDLERRGALAALTVVGGAEAAELVRATLASPRAVTRAAALNALVVMRSDSIPVQASVLVPLLGDPAPAVRIAAAQALATIGDPGAIAALEVRLREERDRAVRRAIGRAARALRRE